MRVIHKNLPHGPDRLKTREDVLDGHAPASEISSESGLRRYYRSLTVAAPKLRYGNPQPYRGASVTTVFSPQTEYPRDRLSVLTTCVLIWFHIQAVAAFLTFSWRNVMAALVLHWLAVGIG